MRDNNVCLRPPRRSHTNLRFVNPAARGPRRVGLPACPRGATWGDRPSATVAVAAACSGGECASNWTTTRRDAEGTWKSFLVFSRACGGGGCIKRTRWRRAGERPGSGQGQRRPRAAAIVVCTCITLSYYMLRPLQQLFFFFYFPLSFRSSIRFFLSLPAPPRVLKKLIMLLYTRV